MIISLGPLSIKIRLSTIRPRLRRVTGVPNSIITLKIWDTGPYRSVQIDDRLTNSGLISNFRLPQINNRNLRRGTISTTFIPLNRRIFCHTNIREVGTMGTINTHRHPHDGTNKVCITVNIGSLRFTNGRIGSPTFAQTSTSSHVLCLEVLPTTFVKGTSAGSV